MQAVAAHVRRQHADLLAMHPEAEVVLRAALEACAELQAAQDCSLLSAALRSTTPGLSPQASRRARRTRMGTGGGARWGPTPGGASQPQHMEGGPEVRGKAREEATLQPEDYAAEVAELRSIAARHAEHAAALSELVTRLAVQHASAEERADDLDHQVAALQHEVDNLTRLLVDVKVAFAEKDSEVMRLAQRLKRSLLAEHSTRDEVENLRRRLAALTPDQAVHDAEFGISKQLAAEGLDDSLLHTSQAHNTANGGAHAAAAAAPVASMGPPSLQRGVSLRLLGASTTSNRITSDNMAPATGQGVPPTLT
ncbi:hypothetical protein V8C86DRAFT_1677960 [Haematococcus lacustris]